MVTPSVVAEIGKRLREAREASGRSLDDLAGTTRINRRFLEELEGGVQPSVPDIYVRAFVKTIATELGQDPTELLGLMTAAAAAPPAVPSSSSSSAPSAEPIHAPAADPVAEMPRVAAPSVPPAETQRTGPDAVRRQAKILVGFAFLVVLGLIISVYWLRSEKSEKGVQEISFADVVKEQTAKHQPPDSSADSSSAAPAVVVPETGDSLLLQAVTSESVWVHIELDGSSSNEYTLPPGYKIQWKASKQFAVSLGNPAGISFTLNGKTLGHLSEGKKPLRNHIVSRASLSTR